LCFAGTGLAEPVGQVTHVSGVLLARKSDGTSKIIAPRSVVEPGDLLATAGDTYARVKFTDGGEVTLRPNTQFQIVGYQFDKKEAGKDSAVFNLLKGGLRTVTGLIGKRKPDSYEMRTIVATIGIRGTHYGAYFCQDDCQNIRDAEGRPPANGLHLDVADGMISVKNQGGETVFSAGQFGYVQDKTTPAINVPAGQNVTTNVPTFTPPASGANSGCVVQ
jgi:hypothetical protein